MRKGIIICIKDDYCIVALKNGEFRQIKLKRGMQVGNSALVVDRHLLLVYLILAAFLFAFIFSTFVFAKVVHTTPTGYVSIDINPGIEFTINKFNKVLSVNATNDAGKTIIAGENFINKNIERSISRIIELAMSLGFLRSSPPTLDQLDQPETFADLNMIMLFTMDQDYDKTRELDKHLTEQIRDYSKQNGIFCIVLDKQSENPGSVNLDTTKGKNELLKVAFDENDNEMKKHESCSVKQLSGYIFNKHCNSSFPEAPYIDKKARFIENNAEQLYNFKKTLTNEQIVSLDLANVERESKIIPKKKLEIINDWKTLSSSWFDRLYT